MNDTGRTVFEYAIERVRKGFEFELESGIWHGVLEVLPHTVAGTFGWGVESGHYVIVGGVVFVVVVGIVVRRKRRVAARNGMEA